MIIQAMLMGCSGGEAEDSAIAYDFATTATTSGGTYDVSWTTEPDPLPFNETFSLRFDVPGASSEAAYGLEVTMPAHGHGMQVEPLMTAEEDGLLTEGLIFHMAGVWEVALTVDGEDATFWIDCCE